MVVLLEKFACIYFIYLPNLDNAHLPHRATFSNIDTFCFLNFVYDSYYFLSFDLYLVAFFWSFSCLPQQNLCGTVKANSLLSHKLYHNPLVSCMESSLDQANVIKELLSTGKGNRRRKIVKREVRELLYIMVLNKALYH